MKCISYDSLELMAKCKIVAGMYVNSVDANPGRGITITRIIDGPLDFFLVRGAQKGRDVEVPWSNVAKAIRSPEAPAVVAKGGKAKADE